MKALILAAAATLLAVPAAAEEGHEWGRFSREELFSTHFPEAPGAEAVVLYDHGELIVDANFNLRMRRHRRTKIFTGDGGDRAEVRVPCGKGEKVREVRAQTMIPPNRVVKAKTSEEKTASGGKETVIRFQDVAPGAILEYSYECWTKDIAHIEPWVFQNDDFTRVSRLDLRVPKGMSFEAEFGWVPGLIPQAEKTTVLDGNQTDRELEQTRWTMTNLPAFRAVPLLSSPADFRTKLRVQLVSFRGPGKSLDISPGWDALGESFAQAWANLGNRDDGIAEWAAAATGAAPGEKARGLFRLVRDGITADETGAPVPSEPLSRQIATGRGTGNSKNLLLRKVLSDAGLQAEPVLICPVSAGKFQARWKSVERLRTVVVRLTLDGAVLLLDAGAPGNAFGLLGPDLRVPSGLLVAPGGSRVVTLDHPAVDSRGKIVTKARVGESGTLAAATRWTLVGFEALAARRAIAREGKVAFVRRMMKGRLGRAVVGDVDVSGLEDDGEPVVVNMQFHVPSWATVAGNRIECALPFVFAPDETPLPEGERLYPIEFGYARVHDETVELRVPEGFTVYAGPESMRAGTDELSYALTSRRSPDAVTARRLFTIRVPLVDEGKAPVVQDLYATILRADESNIVARRTSAGAPQTH